MVQVVRNYKKDSAGPAPFEFKVYRNPDAQTVQGHLAGYKLVQRGGGQVTWLFTPCGGAVREAFERTLQLARKHGVRTVWVNDPANLFPEEELLQAG